MKNRARSKSWLCFQAEAIDDPIDSDYKHRPVDPVYIAVKHDKTAMIRKISPDMNLSKISSDKKIGCSGRSRSSRRYLSRIVKAVFFETALRKSKKVQQDPYQSLRSLSDVKSSKRSTKEDNLNSNDSSENFATVPISYSSSSSILSSSTSASNLSSLDQKKASRSNSLELKQIVNNIFKISKQSKPKEMARNRDSSSINGLYLLFISLMVLIFWGRLCAIVCTSTWIYFGPIRRKSGDGDGDEEVTVIKPEGEEEKMESKEYKKRVIMEGLLERSNCRF